jgi:exopolysaccharide biosynthesis polyprenyl glycosylphosphotransferase
MRRDMGTLRYSSEHALAMIAVLVAAFFFTYIIATFDSNVKPGRTVIFAGISLFALLSLYYRRRFSVKFRKAASLRPVYVIGSPKFFDHVSEICQKMRMDHPLRYVKIEEGKEFLQGLEEDDVSRERCEALVIDLPFKERDLGFEEVLLHLNLHVIPVYPVESFVETYFRKIDCSHVTVLQALDGTFKPDHHSPYGNLKTVIDAIAASIILILVLPLLCIISVIIRLQDGGPALFSQVRIGRFERPFVLYKFRTMKVESDVSDPYTAEGDSRITRFGRFLRVTRLDELPQLWNVLIGDMSMIGPRAEWDRLVEKYKKEIRFYNLRYMVKPGITGWAQVNYGYGAGTNDTLEKLQYDLYYIKHYSLEMDAGIVLKTIYVILSASGR